MMGVEDRHQWIFNQNDDARVLYCCVRNWAERPGRHRQTGRNLAAHAVLPEGDRATRLRAILYDLFSLPTGSIAATLPIFCPKRRAAARTAPVRRTIPMRFFHPPDGYGVRFD